MSRRLSIAGTSIAGTATLLVAMAPAARAQGVCGGPRLWVAQDGSVARGDTTSYWKCVLGQSNLPELAAAWPTGHTITWGGYATLGSSCGAINSTGATVGQDSATLQCIINQTHWGVGANDVLLYHPGGYGCQDGRNHWGIPVTPPGGGTVYVKAAFVFASTGQECQESMGMHEVYEADSDASAADCCNGQAWTGCSSVPGPYGWYSFGACGGTYYGQYVNPAGHEFQQSYCQALKWGYSNSCGCTPPALSLVESNGRQTLPFYCGNAEVETDFGDWKYGSYKIECGATQAMTGLSVDPAAGTGHAGLCANDVAPFFHQSGATPDVVPVGGANHNFSGAFGDWDVGYYKSECQTGEYAAGIAQTPTGVLSALLCLPGHVDHSSPQAHVMATGDSREPTAVGDWDTGYYKGECGEGRYLCGVSANTGTGHPHAILCCGTKLSDGTPALLTAAAGDALTFDSQDQQRPAAATDWSPGQYKAECGATQAMTGLSLSPSTGAAHSALCYDDDAAVFTHAGCHEVVFDAGNSGYTGANGDWDVGYYKGECGANEYAAGVSQTTGPLGMVGIWCCPSAALASATHAGCVTEAPKGGNAQQAGADAADWAPYYYKAECAANGYAAGVSQSATTHAPHGILCCAKPALPPRPDGGPAIDASTGRSPETGSAADAGAAADGAVADGAVRAGTMSGGCSCSTAPATTPPLGPALVVVALGLGLLAGPARKRRRR